MKKQRREMWDILVVFSYEIDPCSFTKVVNKLKWYHAFSGILALEDLVRRTNI